MAGTPVFNLAGTAVLSATAATVAWPAHATNHVALLLVQTDELGVTLSTAAGFTRVTGSPQQTGAAAATNSVCLEVFWCRATSATQASVVIADPGDHIAAQIVTYTNIVTSGNPWDVISTGVQGTASTNCQIPSTTTTGADRLIVAVVANSFDSNTNQASAISNANLATPTIAIDSQFNTTQGGGGGVAVGSGGLAVAGAVGTTTVTLANATKQAYMHIALKPDTAISGSGSADAKSLISLAGQGLRGIIGTGAILLGLTLGGAGQQQHTGSGSAAVNLTPSGAGQQQHTGSGTAGIQLGLSGSGTVSNPTTTDAILLEEGADLQLEEATALLLEETSTGISGTGGVSVSLSLAGTGKQEHTGTGTVPVALTLSGTGLRGNVGTGSSQIALTLSGTGKQEHTGTGSAAIQLTTSGQGLRGNTGTGSAAVSLTLSGTGKQQHTGTGTVAISLTTSGTGTLSAPGTGTVAVALTPSGTGKQQHSGTGSVAVALTLSGSGTTQAQFAGSGGVSVSLTTSGTGKQEHTGTGSAAISLTLNGQGTRSIIGSGAAQLQLSLEGTGTSTDPSTRRAGKYGPEHSSALADIAAQNEFTDTHTSVLRDISDAGV